MEADGVNYEEDQLLLPPPAGNETAGPVESTTMPLPPLQSPLLPLLPQLFGGGRASYQITINNYAGNGLQFS